MKPNPDARNSSGTPANSDNNRSNNFQDPKKQQAPANEEFPGYPHYPAKEDIMHPASQMEKISPDPEKLTRSGAYLDKKNSDPLSSSFDAAADSDDDLVIVPGTEADVTSDDLLILGDFDIDNSDEQPVDSKVLSGQLDTGLDVPGEELDDLNEDIGEEDEENNYYSLGGDSKDSLEEN